MAKFLVTGGGGFIGSAITRALLGRGDAVVVLDDFSTGKKKNLESLHGTLEVIVGDVCDERAVRRAVKGCEGVFHQAAMVSVVQSVSDPVRCNAVNIDGTVRVLEAARSEGVRSMVLASSAAVYGDSPELPKHESMTPEPKSPYAIAKLAAEHYLRTAALDTGLRTLSLRYFNIFGPRQDPDGPYASAIPKILSALLRGERATIFGDGLQTRDFCFIDDVVSANLRAIELPNARGQAINIASGKSTTILELVKQLGEIVGITPNPAHAPKRPGDIQDSSADITVARTMLGYAPSLAFARDLRRTVAYFRGESPSC